jgi:hypothetical protein
MSDFNRAIALQATPDQIARFQQLMKSTEAAKKEAQNLMHPVGTSKLDSSGYAELNDTVEEAESNLRQFVTSFSTPQQSELKPQIKKLRKADSDLSKQSKALAEELAVEGRRQQNCQRGGKTERSADGFPDRVA